MDQQQQDAGVRGALWSRETLSLARRAIRQRWGVPDELKTEALLQTQEILSTSDNERHRLAAIRLLVDMDKVDQTDEHEAARRNATDETYDDIPDDEPDVEPRVDPAQAGLQEESGEV